MFAETNEIQCTFLYQIPRTTINCQRKNEKENDNNNLSVLHLRSASWKLLLLLLLLFLLLLQAFGWSHQIKYQRLSLKTWISFIWTLNILDYHLGIDLFKCMCCRWMHMCVSAWLRWMCTMCNISMKIRCVDHLFTQFG